MGCRARSRPSKRRSRRTAALASCGAATALRATIASDPSAAEQRVTATRRPCNAHAALEARASVRPTRRAEGNRPAVGVPPWRVAPRQRPVPRPALVHQLARDRGPVPPERARLRAPPTLALARAAHQTCGCAVGYVPGALACDRGRGRDLTEPHNASRERARCTPGWMSVLRVRAVRCRCASTGTRAAGPHPAGGHGAPPATPRQQPTVGTLASDDHDHQPDMTRGRRLQRPAARPSVTHGRADRARNAAIARTRARCVDHRRPRCT